MNEVNDILIIDDEIPNQRLLAELLKKEGYRVRLAEKAQMAIDSALAQPPSLILLDVRMSDMDGFEVCRQLKQDKRTHKVPVIFISSLQDTEARVQGFESGGIDFITKPLQEQEVLARVRTHIDLYRMLQHQEQLVKERTAELEQEVVGHKEADERLRQSEEHFRSLMEQSPLGIVIYTPDGRIAEVNSALKLLWGFDELQTARLKAEFNILTDPQIEELGVMPLVERAFAGEHVVLPLIKYSGKRAVEDIGLADMEPNTAWIQCHLYSIKDEHGAITCVVVINMDITNLKQAEEELIKSEKRFKSIMEQSPLGIVVFTPEGKISHVNSAWMRLLGLNEEETALVLEKYNFLTDKEAEAHGVMPLVKKAFAGESVVLPAMEYVGKNTVNDIGLNQINPNTVWVQSHITPVKNENNEVEYVLATNVDLTESKQAQTSLEESERKYRELVENINDVIYSVDAKGKVVYVSPAIKFLLGYEPDELMGEHFSDFVHSDDLEAMKKGFESALAGKAIPADYRILNKDGSYIWVRALSKPIKDDNNNIIGIRGVVSDITERKLVERQIREMASFAELNPAPVLRVDHDGIIMSCNPASVEILGKNAKKGTSIFSILQGLSQIDLNKCIRENMLLSKEIKIKGKFYQFILRGVSDLKLLYLYGSNITELKLAEEEMNLLRSELLHTTRRETMGEFSSAIAHELNQPLAAIMSNTQAAQRFLDKKPPSLDKVKLALSNILRNDRRASEVIRKLRILLKKNISEFTEINANDLIEEVVILSRSNFVIKNVSIKMNLGKNIPLVSGDRVQLQQVLINLILNALDSYENITKDEKQIVITTRFENKKEVCLSVKDFGCGIEESVLNKVFDPFVTTKKGGMGMGLAINKTIIDAHRGHIWAENNPDEGATFNIVLPLNKEEIT